MAEGTIPEEWRIVADFPDYEVSNLGRVRRATPAPGLNNMNARYGIGYVLKPFPNPDGYLQVNLKRTAVRISVLVCRAFNGDAPPNKPEVAHWDGNNQNNQWDNLRWATHAENMADLARHGKHRGERHRDAKLTEADVRSIRCRLRRGDSCSSIARDYGVVAMTVWQIKTGKNWGWLPD